MREPASIEAVIGPMPSPRSTSVERLFEAYVQGVEGDGADGLHRLARAFAAVEPAPVSEPTVADGQ